LFVVGSGDSTKKLRLEVDEITTATTRTMTYPDRDVDIGDIYTWPETIDANNQQLYDLETATFEAEHDNGNSGAAATIDWNNGQQQKITLTANCTFTLTAPTVGSTGVFRLFVTDNGSGPYTITWPAGVTAFGDAELNPTNGQTTLFVLCWRGSTTYALTSMDDA
jgi:hypothetical protein